VHVHPLGQTVGPVYPVPPHCPYGVLVPVEVADVVVLDVLVVVVDALVVVVSVVEEVVVPDVFVLVEVVLVVVAVAVGDGRLPLG
jgi:hypothetical protein